MACLQQAAWVGRNPMNALTQRPRRPQPAAAHEHCATMQKPLHGGTSGCGQLALLTSPCHTIQVPPQFRGRQLRKALGSCACRMYCGVHHVHDASLPTRSSIEEKEEEERVQVHSTECATPRVDHPDLIFPVTLQSYHLTGGGKGQKLSPGQQICYGPPWGQAGLNAQLAQPTLHQVGTARKAATQCQCATAGSNS